MAVSIANPPHLSMHISELAAITEFHRWVGTKVTIVGRLKDYDVGNSLRATLESLVEIEEAVYSIPVSFYKAFYSTYLF